MSSQVEHPDTLGLNPLSATGEQAIRGVDIAEYRTLAERVQARLLAERRPNTIRAREQDWAAWQSFCRAQQVDADRADSGALAEFAASLADKGLAPASVLRRVSGVVYGWRLEGLIIPDRVSETARIVAANHERRLLEDRKPVGRGPAPVLELGLLRRVCDALPDTVGGVRDRALVLVGFGIGARRSELAHLDVGDIHETSEGLDVHVRFSKTKPRNPGVPFGKNEQTCPVVAWRAWLKASEAIDGAAFRQVTQYGRVGGRMSPRAVGEAIRRAGEGANLDRKITGHSLRAGMATEARRGGADVVQIARQGGWSETSDSLYRYIRTVDKWTDNAMRGVL